MVAEIFNAVVLGSIQGLTEFLPISSSGHLLLAHELLKFDVADSLTFDVALHLGTLLALLIYFWRDVGQLGQAFFSSLRRRSPPTSEQRLLWRLLLAVVPAAALGLLFEDFFASLRAPVMVVVSLTVVGGLFLLTERRRPSQRSLDNLPWLAALAIGLSQALALIPGVSRSGITIVAGMQAGLSRQQAARFTFLLSIPTVAGAALKKLLDLKDASLASGELAAMLVGIATAALVGYAVVRFLMRFLQNHKLDVFAYYRFAVAFVAVLLMIQK